MLLASSSQAGSHLLHCTATFPCIVLLASVHFHLPVSDNHLDPAETSMTSFFRKWPFATSFWMEWSTWETTQILTILQSSRLMRRWLCAGVTPILLVALSISWPIPTFESRTSSKVTENSIRFWRVGYLRMHLLQTIISFVYCRTQDNFTDTFAPSHSKSAGPAYTSPSELTTKPSGSITGIVDYRVRIVKVCVLEVVFDKTANIYTDCPFQGGQVKST